MAFTVLEGIFVSLIAVCVLAIMLNRLAPLTTARWLRNALRCLAGLQAKTIQVQGQTFPYLVGGTGEPMVLVHGFTADKDTWGAVARHLTAKYTVIAPDLPGFGDSARDPQANYSLDMQVENLRVFLQRMGITRVHLGGQLHGRRCGRLICRQVPTGGG